jgi:hypothetical protein
LQSNYWAGACEKRISSFVIGVDIQALLYKTLLGRLRAVMGNSFPIAAMPVKAVG